MIRYIIAAGLLLLPLTAQGQNPPSLLSIGFVGRYSSASQFKTIDGGNTLLAWCFRAPASDTINSIRFKPAYCTGMIAGELRWDIYSWNTSTNKPNVSLQNSTTTSGAITATWNEQTGFTQAVTAGTIYCAVTRNLDVVPGSNYCGWNVDQNLPGQWADNSNGTNFMFLRSTNSLATPDWNADRFDSTMNIIIKMQSGARIGWPYSDYTRGSDGGSPANRDVYSTREVGNLITSPANLTARLRCIGMDFSVSGAPTAAARFRIYQGTTLLDTTRDIAVGTVQTGAVKFGCFDNAVTMDPGTAYRVVLGENTNADSSSNVYRVSAWDNSDTQSGSDALRPWNGSCQFTYYNGSAWTDSATSCVPMVLGFDSGNEFVAAGGGVGNLGKMSGGMQ